MKLCLIFSLAVLPTFASVAESGNGLEFRTSKIANESKPHSKAKDCLLARIGGEVSSRSNLRAVSREKVLPSNTERQALSPNSNISRTMPNQTTKPDSRTLDSKVRVEISINTLNAAHSVLLTTLKESEMRPPAEARIVDALSELNQKRKTLPPALTWTLERLGKEAHS